MMFLLAGIASIAQTQTTAVMPGDTVVLTVTGANGAIQWQQSIDSLSWSDLSGLTDSVVTFITTSSGSFTSYNDLNVTDAYYYAIGVAKPGGCSPAGSKTIYNMSLSNIETNISGIRENQAMHHFSISPNPFKDKTIIEFNNPQNDKFRLVITDITGKIVRRIEETRATRLEIDRNGLPAGIYTIELTGQEFFKSKLIIE
ncbi:MAG: T9SS type A sorting domain-containing protein [Bacteroidia bacterium]|nr:T9SS type A sorting domain-containing protein [Bacteroidia bacterium]